MSTPKITYYNDIETLQAAVVYLMSRHGMITSKCTAGCPACAAISVVQHLNMLIEHPALESSVLKNTYNGLLNNWKTLAKHHEETREARETKRKPIQMQVAASSLLH